MSQSPSTFSVRHLQISTQLHNLLNECRSCIEVKARVLQQASPAMASKLREAVSELQGLENHLRSLCLLGKKTQVQQPPKREKSTELLGIH